MFLTSTGSYEVPGEPGHVFRERLVRAREWLTNLPYQNILVVCHWGVILGLTGRDLRNLEACKVSSTELLPEPYMGLDWTHRSNSFNNYFYWLLGGKWSYGRLYPPPVLYSSSLINYYYLGQEEFYQEIPCFTHRLSEGLGPHFLLLFLQLLHLLLGSFQCLGD